MPGLQQVAFYYPGPLYRDDAWVKNSVPFFDSLAFLTPSYIKDKLQRTHGDASRILNTTACFAFWRRRRLLDQGHPCPGRRLDGSIATGALDDLAIATEFHELS